MKHLFLIILVESMFHNLFAKEDKEGYYVTKSNDTVNVVFKIPFDQYNDDIKYEDLQWHIKYYDAKHEKQVLKPEFIKEVVFYHKDKKVKIVSLKNTLALGKWLGDNDYMFLQLIRIGKIRVYKYYETTSGGMNSVYGSGGGQTMIPTSGTFTTKYILQKGNEKLFTPSSVNFKKEMAEYLRDCTDLVENIECKKFKKNEILKLIDAYNSECK